jgi:iron complex transport system permease protein
VAQGLFRNPLADPYLLGSASGASLGVAVALLMFGGSAASARWVMRLGLTGAAFIGAVLAVMLTLMLARGVQQTLRLLLAGVIVGVVLGAAKDLITIASADILQAIQGFMLGSTGLVGWSACAVMGMVCAVCLLLAWALAPVLDGWRWARPRRAAWACRWARCARRWSWCWRWPPARPWRRPGLIAFVGLVAPHLVRSVVKTTHARTDLLSALMGGLLLMAADLLARWLIAPQELPVGVLTAVLGGSYLLWLMHRRSRAGRRGMSASRHRSARAQRHARRDRGAARHRPAAVGRPLDQHRRPQRRGQVDLAQGAGRPARAPKGEVRLFGREGIPARARTRPSWLGQSGTGEGSADDLMVYDVAMLGRLPHQPWLAPRARPTARPWSAPCAARRPGTGATALGQLSGGERQRVLLARALAVRGRGAADGRAARQPRPAAPGRLDADVPARSWPTGKTVVSVLHELPMALAGRRMVVMDHGRVVHHGGCDDPATHTALEQVFDHRIRDRAPRGGPAMVAE